MSFTLGGEAISVVTFTGFDLPDDIQVVPLLSDGTTTHNTVLQGSGSQMPRAVVTGRTTDEEEIQLLKMYRSTHDVVTFVEPLDGSHSVVVMTLTVSRAHPATFQFEWTMEIAEVTGQGGSGS
jgi:hypothetical protein